MKLYHGTTIRNLDNILAHGLRQGLTLPDTGNNTPAVPIWST